MKNSNNRRETNLGIQMAFEVVGIIVGSILCGVFLDGWLGWSPVLTLIFSFAGIIGAFVKMLSYGGKKS